MEIATNLKYQHFHILSADLRSFGDKNFVPFFHQLVAIDVSVDLETIDALSVISENTTTKKKAKISPVFWGYSVIDGSQHIRLATKVNKKKKL